MADILPVKLIAIAQGVAPERAAELAWQAGLVACLGSGLIEYAAWQKRWLSRSEKGDR